MNITANGAQAGITIDRSGPWIIHAAGTWDSISLAFTQGGVAVTTALTADGIVSANLIKGIPLIVTGSSSLGSTDVDVAISKSV